jgi:hypothetical protein
MRPNPDGGGYVLLLSRGEVSGRSSALVGLELDQQRRVLHGGYMEISENQPVHTGGVVDPRRFAHILGIRTPQEFQKIGFVQKSVLEERTFSEVFQKFSGLGNFADSAFRNSHSKTPGLSLHRALSFFVSCVYIRFMIQNIFIAISVWLTVVSGDVWTSSSSASSHTLIENGKVVEDVAQAAIKETKNGKTLRGIRKACDLGQCVTEEEPLFGFGGPIQSFLQRGFN